MSHLKKEVKHEKKREVKRENFGRENRAVVMYAPKKEGKEAKVAKPVYMNGNLQQKGNAREVLSAWDEMLVAKCHPGMFNSPYVAGMNCTNLPTTTFSVGEAIEKSWHSSGTFQPLGSAQYTLIMWCPAVTAFAGAGGIYIPNSDRLGGLAICQFTAADAGTNWIARDIF